MDYSLASVCGAIWMVQNSKSNLTLITRRKIILSFLIILLFSGFSFSRISANSLVIVGLMSPNFEINAIPVAHTIVPIDIVFTGYNEEYVDVSLINDSLSTSLFYTGVDYVWNEDTQSYDSLLDLEITLKINFHFTSLSYSTDLDSFIDANSWNSNTSALNTTQLNLQEDTGERMSIFYDQEGRAINGTAVEQYLVDNKGIVSDDPSYIIHFLNQSRFDSSDHSQEHWFEIDEVDPDSNITADWWRLEWDNDLNPDVEFPYPCWGYQNRLFFIDPYSHQWYTKWTDIWWNPDYLEGDFNYLTVDLDTYLEGFTPGTPDFTSNLNNYLIDYLNDILSDVGGRGDGLLYDQKEISSQILFINNETDHGYSKEDLNWIYHEKIAEEAFEYVVPQEVANITFEETWVDLSVCSDLKQIIDNNIMDDEYIGSYPWYNENWTYLWGIGIFEGFQSIAGNYFDMSKGDSTLTSWILLLENISMVGYAYNEFREYTGLGGGGNVVCFKDLNRYFASDGITPRSGVTTLLIHELGHVLGFLHAEITNDADEGTGGFMRDVMSYYCEGTSYFSIFLKDSLYRTSSFVNYYRNKPAIDAYRLNPNHNTTILAEIDDTIEDGETALETMNYLDAFLAFRLLYDLTDYLPIITPTESTTESTSLPLLFALPISLLAAFVYKRKKRS
jgi:hypothetical protein